MQHDLRTSAARHDLLRDGILLHELSVLSAASALTGAAMFVMTGFEVFVAFLQAYIFTILSTVYIKLSVEHH